MRYLSFVVTVFSIALTLAGLNSNAIVHLNNDLVPHAPSEHSSPGRGLGTGGSRGNDGYPKGQQPQLLNKLDTPLVLDYVSPDTSSTMIATCYTVDLRKRVLTTKWNTHGNNLTANQRVVFGDMIKVTGLLDTDLIFDDAGFTFLRDYEHITVV